MGEQTVIGHYVAGQDGSWQPALQQSSDLFKALVADDLNSFEQQLSSVDNSSSFHTVLYWSGSADSNDAASPKVEAKSRTLAMLATHHSAVRVLSYLLSKGCDPKLSCSKDGLSCYEVRGPSIDLMYHELRFEEALGAVYAGARTPFICLQLR